MAESTWTDLDDPTREPEAPTPARTSTGSIVIGASVGRYTIKAHVGSGGMGDVFAAHDPQLNRDVALKLLRTELAGGSPEARARFQREAQALAKLNHPNVVSVYDVGIVDDRVFVTMELIDGPTLAQWLAEKPRTWREIVAVFLEAGRGLAAAHAAGLVHRDFKTSNVMLGDRVRVVDFGLARAADDTAEVRPHVAASTLLDGMITRTGQAVGTPAYMSPEQQRGEPVTALSDQYSFGVALHEALFGARPQPGLAEPPSRSVPAHLRAVVERALSELPQDRFVSMRELLSQLARDPVRTRRRLGLVAIAVGVIITASFMVARRTSDAGPSCDVSEDRLAGVWDPTRRASVHAAFVSTKKAYSEEAWTAARGQIDRYVSAWLDMQRESCRATRIVGEQSDALMDLRSACLDRRRSALDALLGVWEAGLDANALEAASDAVGRLAPVSDCADTRALTVVSPMPTDPGELARLAVVRAYLDRSAALMLAGRYREARASASTASRLADELAWPPTRAEALRAQAAAVNALGEAAAEPLLLRALREAQSARDDQLVANLLVELVDYYALSELNAPRALPIAAIADGAVARAGDEPHLRVRLLKARADALRVSGKYAEADELYKAAHARAVASFGATANETIDITARQALLARARGDLAATRALSEATLSATEALFGPNHPRIASILNGLGDATQMMGDYDAAASYYPRALSIVESVNGRESVQAATIAGNLGGIEIQRNNLGHAEELLHYSIETREKLQGREHPQVAIALGNLAMVRKRQGRFDEALALYTRVLAIKVKAYGPDHASVAFTHEGIGAVYAVLRRDREAHRAFERARQIREKALGRNHPLTIHSTIEVAEVLVRLGRCREAQPMLDVVGKDESKVESGALNATIAIRAECDLSRGDLVAARARVERLVAAAERQSGLVDERGQFRWLQARVLRASGREREAVEAARLAERDLDTSSPLARDVKAYLARKH